MIAYTHGAAIGEILAQATSSAPFAFIGTDNASISRIVVTPERWVLRGYNDTAHLAGCPEPLRHRARSTSWPRPKGGASQRRSSRRYRTTSDIGEAANGIGAWADR